MSFFHATPKRFLRKKAVAERYSISEREVDRRKHDKRIPAPYYKEGCKNPLWAEDELDENDAATMTKTPAEVRS